MTSLHAKLLAAALAVASSPPVLAAEVDRRQENQQARIGEGVESGQLTPRETARLEGKEARTRHEIRREKARINRQENRTSRQIYREKHNDRHM